MIGDENPSMTKAPRKKIFRIHRRSVFLVVMMGLVVSSCNMPLSDDQITGTLGITPDRPTDTPPALPAHISGIVWHDLCALPSEDQSVPEIAPQGCVRDGDTLRADGVYDQNEPGIEDLLVSLGRGRCPSTGLAQSITNAEGVFAFLNIEPGEYCVSVDPTHPQNADRLLPGSWTSHLSFGSGVLTTSVTLEPDRDTDNLRFGWDYQLLPPFSPVSTDSQDPTEISPSPTPTQIIEETETPPPVDPDLPTGPPDYRDLMINPGNWFGAETYVNEDEHARYELENGKMTMTAFNDDLWQSWRLSWPEIDDFYLEIFFETEACSGADRYGIMARGEEVPNNAYGYLFGVSCDGEYSLTIFDDRSNPEGSYTTLIEWTPSDLISSGSDQVNVLGFWAKGNQLQLYVNGQRMAEIEDDSFDGGLFGMFIGAAETENFQVVVEEIAYWNLP